MDPSDHLAAMAAADEVLGILSSSAYQSGAGNPSGDPAPSGKAPAKGKTLEGDRSRLKSAERKLKDSPYAPKRLDSLPLLPPKSR
jgi:hypothetical protein